MPKIPYPIAGIVTDIDSNPAVNIKVTVFNLSNGNSQETQTNASGAYAVDLANFVKDYSDGQMILIRAEVIGTFPKLAQLTHKIDTSVGAATINLQLEVGFPTQPVRYPEEEIRIREHDPIQSAKQVSVVKSKEAKDIRFDPNDDVPIYIGLNFNSNNAPTSTKEWIVYKFTYSGSDTTRIQKQEDIAWDNRTQGWA